MADLKKIDTRATEAFQARQGWAQIYDQLYQYCMPNRKPIGRGNTTGTGSNIDTVFDSTAIQACSRFAGRLSRDVTPPFQKFFDLKVGPAAKAALQLQVPPDQLAGIEQRLNKELENVTELVMGVIQNSSFALSAEEMYLDLFGGQGAMLMLEDEDQIVRFVSVPVGEIALREDGFGRITGIYWPKAFRADQLPELWPKGAFSKELKDKIKDKPAEQVTVMQATEWDSRTKKWTTTAFEQGKHDTAPIHVLEERTCPWLTPRFYKLPGEAHGRGPGMMALPTVKTLNKVQELTLKAAAFAILGLWTYRNDRVFNPKTARMVPGAMWAVSSNGGPMGPALQRQEMPGRFDFSNIILQELRQQVKIACFDDTLPPDAAAVRSATEIVERLKRLMNDLSSAYARLYLEVIRPLVQRIIDILYTRRLITDQLPIDELLLKLEVSSPIARSQQASEIEHIVQWLQISRDLLGPEALMLMAKVEDLGAEIGTKLGVSPSLMRTPDERKGMMEMVAKMIAQMQMQQQQVAAPANAPAAMPAAA
jgi:hypothetical protein